MNILCIAAFTILISTASAKATNEDVYNSDYYDDVPESNVIQNDKSTSENSSSMPSFITKPKVINAKEGDTVILDCLTKDPDKDQIWWTKDGESVMSEGSLYDTKIYDYVKANKSLIIKYVKQKSNGYYSCTVLIPSNETVKVTHRLKVENAAEVLSLRAENNKTKLNSGDSLKIICSTKGMPQPGIKWYFKGLEDKQARPLESNPALRTSNSETVVFDNVSMKDSGDYRCEASNGQSTDYQTIHIDVYDKGRKTDSETHSDNASSNNSGSVLSAIAATTPDSIVGGGSAHLLPSIALFLSTLVLLNH